LTLFSRSETSVMSRCKSSCSTCREGWFVVERLLISWAAIVEGGASKAAGTPFTSPSGRGLAESPRVMGAIMRESWP
jgi:hypothetical protein